MCKYIDVCHILDLCFCVNVCILHLLHGSRGNTGLFCRYPGLFCGHMGVRTRSVLRTTGAYMQLSRTDPRFCQQRLYQIFKTLSSSILRISKACEGVRSERKIIINVLMIKMCYSLHISVGTCTILSADLYYKNTAQYTFFGVNKTTVFAVQTCLFCSAESFRSCS